MDERVFSVSELNNYIKNMFDMDPFLAEVHVRGELSNYKVYPSGHHYFTMKDENGAVRCVMFKNSALHLRFRPESGMKVIAFGRVTVYPRDGAYQLYVNSMTPDGVGDLQIAFEQLKEKLLKEGLFDKEHKKPIPEFPGRIAVVTSSAGAAIHDIIRILRKRWPMSKVILLPVRVQGEEAPPEIAGAIRYANRYRVADVMIVGRGGGSIEDLWAFNDERVARAIYDSEIPVISAVGHEPDVTISDFVADLRAATPSNAAELCVPDMAEITEYIDSLDIRMNQFISKKLTSYRERLESLSKRRVLQSPENYVLDRKAALEYLRAHLISSYNVITAQKKERYAASAAKLDALSPLKVLGRGYAIARKTDGTVLKSASDIKSGEKFRLRLKEDEIDCTAD